MNKAIIIGCPGAGKSTFSRQLRDVTGLPLYYLDMLYHKPDRATVPREEFDLKLGEILARDRWIIDGNYQRTLERRLIACDTVFLLDYPTEVCLEGARERVGKVREEIPWVESELDPEFRQAILDFSSNQLPKIYELLEKHGKGKQIIIFKSRQEAQSRLDSLIAETRLSPNRADISAISSGYTSRLLTAEDIEAIYRLSVGNPMFYKYCPPFVTHESILRDMSALPPRTTREQKYYFGFFDGEGLAAVMDLILGFPNDSTAFIGLFMMDKSRQGRGEGSKIISECLRFILGLGYSSVKLAFAKGNPQSEAFWRKNGFAPIGVESDEGNYTAVIMERKL